MRKDMKLLYQFGVIMTVTFLGEVLHAVLPLPVPASIYGLLIMLFCLCAKVIKLNQVKLAADFLIDIMPPMFIPSAVGLITVWAGLNRCAGHDDYCYHNDFCDDLHRKSITGNY